MADADIISRMNGKPRELNQGGTGITNVVYTTDGTTAVVCPLPSASQLASGTGTTGRSSHFRIRAGGRVTGGTTTNYTATLQFGVSTTSTSNTTIEQSTARAVDSANHVWHIEAEVNWDNVSQKLQGRGWSMVANLVDAVAALDNAPTSVDPASNGTQGFVVLGGFSTGNASNVAYLDYFEIVK